MEEKKHVGKKLINSPEHCVDECLYGLAAANSHLCVIPNYRIVIRRDYQQVVAAGKVALMAGGGSGHEPIFAGFVGEGLLTAAAAGSVFASPPANNISVGLRLLGKNNQAGTVIIVANYTGDKLNFGVAAEQAKAEGHRVELVLVGDDCAVVSANKSAGRRGLSGIALAMKIAGAMSENGRSLDDIVSVLKRITSNLGSVGLSLSSCSIPGVGPNFHLEADEMELGLGVHGEAGISRMKLQPVKEAINAVFSHMTNPHSPTRLQLAEGERVVLLINNLGGTSQLEINIVLWETISWLENRNIEIIRVISAPIMTSLEMAGITVTVLRNATNDLITWIDAQTNAPGWPNFYKNITGNYQRRSSSIFLHPSASECDSERSGTLKAGAAFSRFGKDEMELCRSAVQAACTSVLAAQASLNSLDSGCGDGDCGTTLGCGARVILDALEKGKLEVHSPFLTFQQLSSLCQQFMGGASGALYSIFFSAASTPLKNEICGVHSWLQAIQSGIEAITRYGGAEVGDRTMLDALHPACKALADASNGDGAMAAGVAAVAAQKGAESTAGMKAQAGRASYVSPDLWDQMDAGALAVALIFGAIDRVFNAKSNLE